MGKGKKENSVTVGNVVASEASLHMLSNMDLSAVKAFQVSKLLKSCQDTIEGYNTVRKAKLEQYGKKDKEGQLVIENNNYVFKDDKSSEKFSKEMQDLFEEKIKFDLPEIKLSDFGAIKVKAQFIVSLDWLIKE